MGIGDGNPRWEGKMGITAGTSAGNSASGTILMKQQMQQWPGGWGAGFDRNIVFIYDFNERPIHLMVVLFKRCSSKHDAYTLRNEYLIKLRSVVVEYSRKFRIRLEVSKLDSPGR